MTCIDAAIIKALVEHIGMNPDDVPIGGGSGSGSGGSEQSSSTFLDATWDDTGSLYTFTLPEGQELDVGSIIRFQQQNSTNIWSQLVINKYLRSGGITTYDVLNFPIDFNNPSISKNRIEFYGDHYELADYEVSMYMKPNNKTTGIMTNRSYASILELLVSIINSLVEVHKAA